MRTISTNRLLQGPLLILLTIVLVGLASAALISFVATVTIFSLTAHGRAQIRDLRSMIPQIFSRGANKQLV